MRTTIVLPEEHRDRLRQIASERGQRGCSRVVQEAVDRYLRELDAPAVPARPVVTADAVLPPGAPPRLADMSARAHALALVEAAALAARSCVGLVSGLLRMRSRRFA